MHFGGNQQPDGLVSLSPSPLSLPPPPPPQQSRPPQHHTTRNTQRLRDTETETKTQVKRTICTSDTFHDVRFKKPSTFHNGFMFLLHLQNVYTFFCLCIREWPRTPQHSTWNCVGENRPQHMHMYSLVACHCTLNTPKIRILQKKTH